jgi:hypothetical protein
MERTGTIVLRLDPKRLSNPDADLRYVIPDRLAEKSNHAISDDGYDYGPGEIPLMFIFLRAEALDRAVPQVIDLLVTERLLGNDLTQGTVVAVQGEDGYRIVYPQGFDGAFVLP